jgi:hypothetical protein
MRKLLPFGITAALVAVLAMGGAQAVNAATFCVTSPLDTSDVNVGDGACKDALGLCTLRAAIEENNYSGGNTIKLYGGVYPLTSGKELKITKNATITPASVLEYIPFATWISGCNKTRIFNVAYGATVTIKGLTLTDGYSKYGGAIFNSGTLNLEQSLLCDNEATQYLEQNPTIAYFGGGGAVFNKGKLTVKWCDLQNNVAPIGGAIANFMESSLTISFSTLCDNDATFNSPGNEGAGIHNGGSMTLDPVTTIFIHNGDNADLTDDCDGSGCPA